MLIFVGSPANGESTLYIDKLNINQDTLKTAPRCFSTAKESLE